MRLFVSLLIVLAGLSAAHATPVLTAPGRLAYRFDHVAPYPGIRMMEVKRDARGGMTGQLTSDWYGTIAMRHARLGADGRTLTFDTRNLNTPDQPTRTWSALLSPSSVRLDGGIWHSEVHQTGRAATSAEVAKLTFHPVPLPPFRSLAPDGLAQTPPMGWSSWNKFAEHIDDSTIRAIADAMVTSGLRDAGYVYVNIDDGWQGTRGPDGSIRPNARFPDMKALADYVHARGLKLGIYTSPGPRTCAGFEGSYGHVAQDARTFARWGIDYLKYDLCSGEWFYADADTVRRTYSEMGAALRATGRPIIFSLCEYGRFDVGSWGRSVGGHLWRTTGDISDAYDSMARIGFDRNGTPAHAGPGGWNDPDMLEVGNGGMGADEYRSHMTLWAMSAAPLLMGHDVRHMDEATRRLLENADVIAIDQDRLGVQAQRVRKVGAVEIWAKRLAGGDVAVALFNRGEQPADATMLPADAGVEAIGSVRDLWAGAAVPAADLRFTLRPHDAMLLRVTAAKAG